jgi:hypothetical protein
MVRTSTLKNSDLSFWAISVSLFLFSCSPQAEHRTERQADVLQTNTMEQHTEAVTVAAIEEPIDEAYFDLIANTSACLGEDLWIGGKVESTNKVSLSKAGAITKHKVYEVKDLTATGLNTNSYYTLRDSAGTLRAVSDEEGVLRIQLQDGQLQLMPRVGRGAIMVAYKAPATNSQKYSADGNWKCQ